MSSRVGNFSSSEIHRLMSKGRGNWSLENVGASFKSYVKEKRWERKLNRPLSTSVNARPTIWGTYLEKIAFDQTGLDVDLVSIDRCVHPDIECWTGAPDYVNAKKSIVGDIKCPWTLNSFCELVDIIESGNPKQLKEQKKEYYWQLVSNMILTGFDHCELKVFMPNEKQLVQIREDIGAQDFHQNDQWGGILTPDKVAFIELADIRELPHLPMSSGYESMYTLTFTPPSQDLIELTNRVELAQKELLK